MEKPESVERTKFKIKITDKLEKLLELATDDGLGSLFANGKALNDLEMTVEKANLQHE